MNKNTIITGIIVNKMKPLCEKADLSTNEGVLDFYKEVLNYRASHKAHSEEIARLAFDATYGILSDNTIDKRYQI